MAQPLSFRESSVLGWDGDSQSHYGDDLIERIKDPNGSGLDSVTCAVPSPFARLERVKTAFENITKTSNLEPNHLKQLDNVIATQEDAKLVSQTLDIAEMVFQRSIINGLEIVHWDFSEAKQRMYSKGNASKRFAETLEIYLNQDQQFKTENVQIKEFELIKFNNRVIGCTSPSTLFASADIDLSFAQTSLQGNRKLFTQPTPLYLRGDDFQLYLYYLFYTSSELSELAAVFREYLEKSLKILQNVNSELYEKIYKIELRDSYTLENVIRTLETIKNADSIVNYKKVKIGTVELPMKSEKRDTEITGSGFSLISTYKSEKPILVLPPPKPLGDYQEIKYLESNWDKNIHVPYLDSENILEDRILPGTIGVKGAYLTVSDILEPNIIKLPYKIWEDTQHSDFFIGNIDILNTGYLLPLKPLFFKYFSVDDLKAGSEIINGRQHDLTKPCIKLRESENEVSVEVFLPIQNDRQVRFQRTYHKSDDRANPLENMGHVHELAFNLAIFPKFRINELKNIYKVQSVISSDRPNYNLKFFKAGDNSAIEPKNEVKRVNEGDLLSKHCTIEQAFDYIQLTDSRTIPSTTGILIPNWLQIEQGNNEFSFAVDFGTTNTHIEYRNKHDNQAKPFDISKNDIQIATLFPRTVQANSIEELELQVVVSKEFVPHLIGGDSKYSFPHPTVIAFNDIAQNPESMEALDDVNLPFLYNLEKLVEYTTTTKLKWQDSNRILAKLYFTELLLLIRNKVLLNRGNLSKTKLVTFYPSSMPQSKIIGFQTEWEKVFKSYISENLDNIKTFPESIAPFYYYSKHMGTAGDSISIDIGGGTTDVVLFSKIDGVDQPKATTSFRFAANSIFGDGYGKRIAEQHPLLKKYSPIFGELLGSKDGTLADILNAYKKNDSADAISFLFSLEKHPAFQHEEFHYSYKLRNDDQLRIVFLYFYSAILYHIAQWLKYYKLPKPTNFFFSGTGSKILSIIDGSRNFKILSEYTQALIEKALEDKYQGTIKLEFDPYSAKQVTSKGGLELLEYDESEFGRNSSRRLNRVYISSNLLENPTYEELEKDYELEADIVQQIEDYNAFFLDILNNDHKYFAEVFGINSQVIKVFENVCNTQLLSYLREGLADFNTDLDDKTKPLTNPPFFYPIINILQVLMTNLESN